MSHMSEARTTVTVPDLGRMAAAGTRIVMVTAYDAPTARMADASGADVLLVGDSVGNVCLGFENTLPVSLAMMGHHLDAVVRARPRALVLVDLPYLSYHLGVDDTLRNAGGLLQRGAQGVKLEGGNKRVPVVKALVDAEIPVMGHLGLTPQSIHRMGGYKIQGREGRAALEMLDDALRLQEAGCFALVLEGVPAELAARITQELTIPTIGIGAGPGCSGQVLVFHDVVGLSEAAPAKFVRVYMNGFEEICGALASWGADVREGRFPGPQESYILPEATRDQLRAWRPSVDPSGKP
jgi:3-methyl-2-oxobutanoate hydroxymethyltransferase